MSNILELDKLENYLKEHGYTYERADLPGSQWRMERHIVIVYDGVDADGNYGTRLWDAICQPGSYGYEAGLLEIYGNIVNKKVDGDSVVGFLTAEDVIERLEK